MTILIDVSEAEAQFDSLLDRVAQGEEFVIVRGGKPVALMRAERPATIDSSSAEAPGPEHDK
jgi:antitoxin (DNA-binding transcriptional repressor) of toxin-antitoxin stability system